MTSCSSAILGIGKFTSTYARQVYEQMMTLIQMEAWNFTIKLLKLVNSVKADFSFFRLNLNTVVQEKTPET